MSTVWQAWIYCDGEVDCDFRSDAWLVGEGTASPTEQRVKLKSDGWSRYRGRDYCPQCTEARVNANQGENNGTV